LASAPEKEAKVSKKPQAVKKEETPQEESDYLKAWRALPRS